MNAKHTEGKLHVVSHPDGWSIQDRPLGAGQCVAEWYGGSGIENARRLVACWNACEGMSVELIDRVAAEYRNFNEWAEYHLQKQLSAERDRDRLLADNKALREALAGITNAHGYVSYLSDSEKENDPTVVNARAILAKTEGK